MIKREEKKCFSKKKTENILQYLKIQTIVCYRRNTKNLRWKIEETNVFERLYLWKFSLWRIGCRVRCDTLDIKYQTRVVCIKYLRDYVIGTIFVSHPLFILANELWKLVLYLWWYPLFLVNHRFKQRIKTKHIDLLSQSGLMGDPSGISLNFLKLFKFLSMFFSRLLWNLNHYCLIRHWKTSRDFFWEFFAI